MSDNALQSGILHNSDLDTAPDLCRAVEGLITKRRHPSSRSKFSSLWSSCLCGVCRSPKQKRMERDAAAIQAREDFLRHLDNDDDQVREIWRFGPEFPGSPLSILLATSRDDAGLSPFVQASPQFETMGGARTMMCVISARWALLFADAYHR